MKNCTPATLTLSDTVATTETKSKTVDREAGAVIATDSDEAGGAGGDEAGGAGGDEAGGAGGDEAGGAGGDEAGGAGGDEAGGLTVTKLILVVLLLPPAPLT